MYHIPLNCGFFFFLGVSFSLSPGLSQDFHNRNIPIFQGWEPASPSPLPPSSGSSLSAGSSPSPAVLPPPLTLPPLAPVLHQLLPCLLWLLPFSLPVFYLFCCSWERSVSLCGAGFLKSCLLIRFSCLCSEK